METYQEFLDRIHSFEKEDIYYGSDCFSGNSKIAEKVNRDNSFKDFYGDTIVFNLDDITKVSLAKLVEQLYQLVPECFCKKLSSSTLHMTLHDLSNASALQDVASDFCQNELKILKKTKEIDSNKRIKMKSTYIFNMCDISLVLGLYPINEQEYNALMNLYYMFDDVKKLNYPFTPHITLAYYNRNGFDIVSARKLESIVSKFNKNQMEIELDVNNLFYQRFTNMNDYTNILCLGNN
ncbi:MAG: hypothetical protein J1E83_02170 [Lachnospiraceae bacterium]|nr:hypothetical protein [Lachnospiraceae bacterium]